MNSRFADRQTHTHNIRNHMCTDVSVRAELRIHMQTETHVHTHSANISICIAL